MSELRRRIVLDSSVVIAHLRRRLSIYDLSDARDSLRLPLVALGEIYVGAHKSARPAANRLLIDDLLQEAAIEVIIPTLADAEWYAKVAVSLALRGTPIPQNDTWIAATAFATGSLVATQDEHFRRIDGLPVMIW